MTEQVNIYVDADACPVVQIVEEIAQKYNVPVTLLCDTNHVLSSDYSDVKIIGDVAHTSVSRLGKILSTTR